VKYEILGGNMPVAIVEMEPGEAMFTESGGMSWMDDAFDMTTSSRGGAMKALKRSFGGESLFMTTYTCNKSGGKIAFASTYPGEMKAVRLEAGQSLICAKGTFRAAEESVDVSIFFKKSLKVGVFGGAGFILQKLTGPGLVFLEIDGAAIEYDLAAGQMMKIDPGHIAVFTDQVKYDLVQVKGIKNIFLSGEGLFFSTLTGPGKVWLQSMPISNLVEEVMTRMPTSGGS